MVARSTLSEMDPSGSRTASRFERWTNTNITGVSSSAVMTRWGVVAGAASIAAILVALAVLRSGIAAAGLFGVGSIVLLALFVSRWFVVTAKARRYLVTRHDLGDWTRLAILAAVYVSIPIGVGLVLLVIAVAAQAI